LFILNAIRPIHGERQPHTDAEAFIKRGARRPAYRAGARHRCFSNRRWRLCLVAEGLSNEAIGAKLFISVGTVKWCLNGIYHKLDVRNRTEAVACARQRHLL
jgi:ATP/maltotriose-dependent transcriptional regulator MalT